MSFNYFSTQYQKDVIDVSDYNIAKENNPSIASKEEIHLKLLLLKSTFGKKRNNYRIL